MVNRKSRPYQIFLLFLFISQWAIPAVMATSRNYYRMPYNFGGGFHVSDLESVYTQGELEIMSEKWQITTTRQVSETQARIGKCKDGTTKFFGGIGVFGNSDSMNITYAVHSIQWMSYSITFRAFNMDESDSISLSIDGAYSTFHIPPADKQPTDSPCLDGVRHFMFKLVGMISWRNPTFTIKVISQSTKSVQQAGFAISDVQFLSRPALSGYSLGFGMECPQGRCHRISETGYCSPTEYGEGGVCKPCHQSCSTCAPPQQNESTDKFCFSCAPGFTFFGEKCEKLAPNFHREDHRNYRIGPGVCADGYVQSGTGNCVQNCQGEANYPVTVGLDKPRACAAKCPQGQFMAYNFTCVQSCPPMQRRSTPNMGDFCDYPCLDKQEYLYANGSCFTSCPYEKKVYQPGNYMFCEGGTTSSEVIINNTPTTLFFFDIWAHAHKEVFQIEKRTYHLDATWAFFGLDQRSAKTYQRHNWETSFSCGCQPQRCGSHCANTSRCESTGEDSHYNPLCWFFWTESHHYCWNVYSEGVEEFHSYNLRLVSVFSLLDFGGDGIDSDKTGFTISNKVNNQTFASNALITEFTTTQKIEDLVYATSENRIVLREELEVYNQVPKIEVDLKNAYCNSHEGHLHRKIMRPTISGETHSIISYQILNKAPVKTFDSLNRLKILTPVNGVQEWSSLRPFVFIDPCNQMYLTLLVDRSGAFSVKPPGHQKLLVDNVICIAVNLDHDDSRNLVLYETKVGGTQWKPSDRFTGILSRDFIEKVHLQVTTRSSIPLDDKDDDDDVVNVEINADTNPPRLFLKTHAPMRCDVHVSPNCSFHFVTTNQNLNVFESVTNCGYWYERVAAQCDGFVGYVYPPSSLVQAPIRGYHLEKVEEKEVSTAKEDINKNDHYFEYFILVLMSLTMIFLLAFRYVSNKFFTKEEKIKHVPLATTEQGVLPTEENELRVETEPATDERNLKKLEEKESKKGNSSYRAGKFLRDSMFEENA